MLSSSSLFRGRVTPHKQPQTETWESCETGTNPMQNSMLKSSQAIDTLQQHQQQLQQQHPQSQAYSSSSARRNGTMAMSQRSHSAAPGENYRDSMSPRRGSLSPSDDRYLDFPTTLSTTATVAASASGSHSAYGSSPRFQSRSATATPTGSPKKRQLPQVPQSSRSANIRERLTQDFDERGGSSGGRFARYRMRQNQHQQTYRSTGMGGKAVDRRIINLSRVVIGCCG